MAHAKLSPSAAHRWLACPASVKESEGVVSSDTEASRKGTAAHEVMKLWFDNGAPPSVGRPLANGLHVTQEMLDLTLDAVDWTIRYLDTAGKHTLMTEERVNIGPVFDLDGDECFGTADILALTRTEMLVADLKTGYTEVQAEENPQLLLYAAGAGQELGWLFDTVRMVIIQPANGGVKEWVLSKADLLARIDRMKPRVKAALSEDAPYNPGEEQCRYCPAAGVCKALQAQSLAIARSEFSSVDALVNHLSVEELSEILAKADMIEAAVKAAREHALRLLQVGQPVPGWKMVEGRKNRVWKEDTEGVVAATLTVLGYDPDQFAPRKLLSPAQVEKMLKNKDAVAGFIEKPAGNPVLAPESDKRPALAAQVMDAIPDTGNLLE